MIAFLFEAAVGHAQLYEREEREREREREYVCVYVCVRERARARVWFVRCARTPRAVYTHTHTHTHTTQVLPVRVATSMCM